MKIISAVFLKSSAKAAQCPPTNLPEFAFIGRSNVGKSSLINMITGVKGLAKTSGTPGKTRLINHYVINNEWYLVDLPGYGYARISKKIREDWGKMIQGYLKTRTNLKCIFILVDIRLAPQPNDLKMMERIADQERPFVIIFTKADKLTKNDLAENVQAYRNFLEHEWEVPPINIVTSSATTFGKDELLTFIEQIMNS